MHTLSPLVLPVIAGIGFSCITYGAYKIPLTPQTEEGKLPARIWVARDLEVLAIDGEEFRKNLNTPATWWYRLMGLDPYAWREFYIKPGVHEFRVQYRRVSGQWGFQKKVISQPGTIRVDLPAGEHVCICHDLPEGQGGSRRPALQLEARIYRYPEDFIPEGVWYVEGWTKLVVPRDCYGPARSGRVIARSHPAPKAAAETPVP